MVLARGGIRALPGFFPKVDARGRSISKRENMRIHGGLLGVRKAMSFSSRRHAFLFSLAQAFFSSPGVYAWSEGAVNLFHVQ
jgi:hypothetical protein